ncbi:hypothetical protein Q8F55_006249 [Vanrija albida]|uniref:Ion transport domain-containing protein n=1 Tax=Vanrija albida TaxID=181172 RepID=A0ABR3PWN1_9TREE
MTTPAQSGNGAAASGTVAVTTVVETTSAVAAPSSPLIGGAITDTEDDGTTVFELVHALHTAITAAIDTPMTWEELKSPSVNYTLVKPIVQQFMPTEDDEDDTDADSLGGVLYAIFANRVQFINLGEEDLSWAPLQNSRALFCELLAIKILRTSPTVQDEAELCSELVRTWSALEGAPARVIASLHDGEKLVKTRTSALDLAIVSGSKKFLSQPLVQHLITLIYDGDLIYAPVSSNALIADNLSVPTPARRRHTHRATTNTEEDDEEECNQPVEVYAYNPYKAGWLDYQRLRVPKWRRWIEFLSLTALITLFLLTLSTRRVRHPIHFTNVEILFIAYTFGFILDEFAASKEHGLSVYLASVWNTFDLTFIGIFLTYVFLRLRSLWTHDASTADLGYDILSLGACILFPRLAFILIQDNVVLLALRGMIATFFGFMALIAIAFSGIFFCLWTMGKENPHINTGRIFGLMFSTWFGGSSSVFGFERVRPEEIHPTLGPGVLFAYALLCGLFLVPMLTSLLSNKFSAVRSNANEEYLFQRVVTTVEGVKSDAIFSYLPPFNIGALIILLPLGEFASPQTLHRVNVFLIRLTNFPLLFLISAYERSRYRALRRAVRLGERGVHPEKNSWTDTFLGGGAQSVITAAFEVAPPVVKQESPTSASPTKAGADVKPGKDVLGSAAKNGKNKAAPPPLSLTPSKAVSHGLESPLGRLFRQDRSSAATVTVTAEEWAEVRDSQKRLEEMLEKVLAVTGAAK